MKIVAGNYFGKNIQFVCRCCNCVYEVESKDDWNVQMIFPNYCSFKYKVPEYGVTCPNCGHEEYLGGDDLDCKNIKFFAFCNHLYYIIFDIVTKPYFMKDVMVDKDKRQN